MTNSVLENGGQRDPKKLILNAIIRQFNQYIPSSLKLYFTGKKQSRKLPTLEFLVG